MSGDKKESFARDLFTFIVLSLGALMDLLPIVLLLITLMIAAWITAGLIFAG